MFAIWNATKWVGGKILIPMDWCAVKINRCTPCVRKTLAFSGIIGVPFSCMTGSFYLIDAKISPGAIKNHALSLALLAAFILGLYLFNRYGCILSRDPFVTPPKDILILLLKDAMNEDLPQEHRTAMNELLQRIADRGLEERVLIAMLRQRVRQQNQPQRDEGDGVQLLQQIVQIDPLGNAEIIS